MHLRHLILILFLAGFANIVEGQPRLKLATTTSTYDSGLLDVLLPSFERKLAGKVTVDVIAVGTGKALKLAENGDVDVVLVHAPDMEATFVAAGYGVNKRSIMYNDFVIVGPIDGEISFTGTETAVDTFVNIAQEGALFFSRADASGTHRKERLIWNIAKIDPLGDWYIEAGQGMAATLRMADEKRGYVLIDRGTYLALKETVNLEILVADDPLLYNPYSVIAVNPKRWPHTNYNDTLTLIEYLTSSEGQALIGGYRKYNQRLFTPSAKD